MPPAVNGNVARPYSQATAGVQKWSLVDGAWQLDYVLNTGLNIGVSYGVANYPAAPNPATGGCRHITGRINGDGTVTLYATASTISPSGDQGADPTQPVRVTDMLTNTTLPLPGRSRDGAKLGVFCDPPHGSIRRSFPRLGLGACRVAVLCSAGLCWQGKGAPLPRDSCGLTGIRPFPGLSRPSGISTATSNIMRDAMWASSPRVCLVVVYEMSTFC